MRVVLACAALSCFLCWGQADAGAPWAHAGFAGGLTAIGPGLADEFRCGLTLEAFVRFIGPDSTRIRVGFHWVGFGLPTDNNVAGVHGPGDERPVDGSIDDLEGVSVTDARMTVLWPDRGGGMVRAYAGSGIGLVRTSFEDHRDQWGCVVSPTIGVSIRGSRLRLSLETGIEMVFAEKNRFVTVPVRLVFPAE